MRNLLPVAVATLLLAPSILTAAEQGQAAQEQDRVIAAPLARPSILVQEIRSARDVLLSLPSPRIVCPKIVPENYGSIRRVYVDEANRVRLANVPRAGSTVHVLRGAGGIQRIEVR